MGTKARLNLEIVSDNVSLSREAVAENSDPTRKWSANGYLILQLAGGLKTILKNMKVRLGRMESHI